MERRAKIVCTLGPATRSAASIHALIEAGMDVARLNLSHGTHAEHAEAVRLARAGAESLGKPLAVLADLQGPRIRLGRIEGGKAVLDTGTEFQLVADPVLGTSRRAGTTYPDLARDVRPGNLILINDGQVRLRVVATDGATVRTDVIEGGLIGDHKGINLPDVRVGAPALGEKDVLDLRFVLGIGVDFVALSFVRAPEDAVAVRRIVSESGKQVPVIAKLERIEAVQELEPIVEAFDGLMVARGDLGIELPLEQVPLVQKRAIHVARAHAKPVIVATQMLESMIHASRPTRAEVSDVANAVLDGADALMLSAETSIGERPAEATATMSRIIVAAEGTPATPPPPVYRAGLREEALAAAATRVADDLGASAIAAFTVSGRTAGWLARQRPARRVLAFTTHPEIRNRLALTWGIETLVVVETHDTDTMVRQVERALVDHGIARAGELVVIVAGAPPGTSGSTNTLRVHRVGEAG